MKEIRVELRRIVKNNRLYSAINTQFGSMAEFCRRYKFNYEMVGRLVTLKDSAYYKDGKHFGAPIDMAVRMAEIFEQPVEWLFPVDLYARLNFKSLSWRRKFILSVDEVRQLGSQAIVKEISIDNPTATLENDDRAKGINFAIDTLTERERNVIERRFGLNGRNQETLLAIGKDLNVSMERIRNIETNAINKLRNPRRSKNLRGLI